MAPADQRLLAPCDSVASRTRLDDRRRIWLRRIGFSFGKCGSQLPIGADLTRARYRPSHSFLALSLASDPKMAVQGFGTLTQGLRREGVNDVAVI